MAVDFACRGKRVVLKDVAAACGLEETRPSKWRRDPRFRDALTNTIASEHKHLSVAARTSMYQLAIQGNFMAFDRIREVERDIERLANPTPEDGGVNFGGGTHVHIHAIPERQPMSALPPTLTLPAQSVQSVTTTPAK